MAMVTVLAVLLILLIMTETQGPFTKHISHASYITKLKADSLLSIPPRDPDQFVSEHYSTPQCSRQMPIPQRYQK